MRSCTDSRVKAWRGRYHVERLTVRRATIRRPTIKSPDGGLSSSDCRLSTNDWQSGNMWVDMSPAVSRLARHSNNLGRGGGDGGLSTSGLTKSAWARVVILHLQLSLKSSRSRIDLSLGYVSGNDGESVSFQHQYWCRSVTIYVDPIRSEIAPFAVSPK